MKLAKRRRYPLQIKLAAVIVAAGVAVTGAIYLAQKPDEIKTGEISGIGSGGSLRRNGEPLATKSPKQIQAQSNEIITFTSRPIEVEQRANAAVLFWKQSGEKGVNLEVRTKNNSTWTDWTDLELHENTKDNHKPATDLQSSLVLADNIDSFEYRATLKGDSTPSDAVDFSSSTLETIDSKESATTAWASSLAKLTSSPKTLAQGAHPRIISRAAWGSPEPDHSSWSPEYSPVRRAIIHHTATTESSNSYNDVRAIWQYHAQTLGWGDIGYNYIIDSHGNIFQGRYFNHEHARRTNTDVVGGHALSNNVGTTGISMIGNYQERTPTNAALDSMSQVVGYKLAKYNLDPHTPGVVIGHRDVNSTSCPGNNIVARYDTIKGNAAHYSKVYASFEPMQDARWMNIKPATVRKQDLRTLEHVDGELPSGTHLKFVDKRFIDGEWYLRTAFDSQNDIHKGIKLRDLVDIQPTPLPTSEMKQLSVESSKFSPTKEIRHHTYPQNHAFTFDSKITVNNRDYYRSSYDTLNNIDSYIDASQLKELTLVPFETPRYLHAPTQNIPLTIENAKNPPVQPPVAHEYFTHKVTVNSSTFYQSRQNSQAQNNLVVSAEKVKDVQVTPLSESTPIALLRPASKYNLSTLAPATGLYQPSEYDILPTYGTLEIDGKLFYQTSYDHQNSQLYGFRAEDVTVGLFESLETPIEKKLLDDTRKKSLSGLQDIDGVLPKDTQLSFSSKITIEGKEYYRTTWDTERAINKVIPVDMLR